MPIRARRRPADDRAGFDGQPIHLPNKAHAVIGILQEDVTLPITVKITRTYRMPSVCGRCPADDAAIFDSQAIHLPDEAHAIGAVLQEDVAVVVAVEVAPGRRIQRNRS